MGEWMDGGVDRSMDGLTDGWGDRRRRRKYDCRFQQIHRVVDHIQAQAHIIYLSDFLRH